MRAGIHSPLTCSTASWTTTRWSPVGDLSLALGCTPTFDDVDKPVAEAIDYLLTVEQVATGLRWAEGPVYFADSRYLLVSDIPNDRIMRYDEATGQTGVFRAPFNFSNGLCLDRQGACWSANI
jgi:hypothetical protein